MTLQLLPCPSCQRVAALTIPVEPAARLRCPHCGEEFQFSTLYREPRACWEVLESAPTAVPPAAEEVQHRSGSKTIDMTDASTQTLVDSLGRYADLEQLPATDAHSSTSPAFQSLQPIGSDATDNPETTLAQDLAHDSAATAADTQGDQWSAAANLAPQASQRYRHAQRRPSGPPIWSIVQVALGGVAAIPIALLLVWHLVGSDVADAGPWVGRYLPWIVPERFRPYQDVTSDSEDWQRPSSQVSSGLPGISEAQTLPHETPLLENAFALMRQVTERVDSFTTAAQRSDSNLRGMAFEAYRTLSELGLVISRLPTQNVVQRLVRRQLHPLADRVREEAYVRKLVADGSVHWLRTKAAASPDAQATEFGLALLVVIDQAQEQSAAGESSWWQVSATNANQAGEQFPLPIRIPADLAVGELALEPGRTLFLLGTVRTDAQVSTVSPAVAPNQQTFVACYAVPIN